MRYHAPSRRMFLCGTGAALALPLLESLLPRSAFAATSPRPPVRYIQISNAYGPIDKLFFGPRVTNTRAAPNINVQRLTDVAGPISPIFGAAFEPFKAKMSLVRGMDVLARNANHHFCFATCASSYNPGLDGDAYPPSSGQQSIDSLLASSSKIYSSDVPEARKLVSLNPDTTDDYTRTRSFSWNPGSSGLQMVKPIKTTDAFYGVFESGFGAGVSTDPREAMLMSAVWNDYKSVRDGTRISASDRTRLDNYMGLISDISRGAAACKVPTQAAETDADARLDNQFRLLAAAMACNLTRVANITLGMSAGYGTRHAQHHSLLADESAGKPTGLHDDFVAIGGRVARLLAVLESFSEGAGGTLLDNTIVYYSMQYGMQLIGSQHNAQDMAVMIAGGGGGALDQGRFIDYRKEIGGDITSLNRLGLPINNLLVSILNAMGLSSSDYELAGHQGYGDYPDAQIQDTPRRPDFLTWVSTAGRRTPLPVLYKGPQLG